jgi:hypothetical protein
LHPRQPTHTLAHTNSCSSKAYLSSEALTIEPLDLQWRVIIIGDAVFDPRVVMQLVNELQPNNS